MRLSFARRLLAIAFAAALVTLTNTQVRAQEPAQQPTPKRPRITGISHVGYFVSDLPKSIAFWHDFLGFDESYDLKKPGSDKDVRIAFIKINDHQHIELFNEPPTAPPNMMSHLCFTVDDIEAMRAYLRSQGFQVKPGGGKTRTGDYAFEIKDPDGMLVEFVQGLPTGMEAQAAGKFEPPTRISDKIYHVGFLVGNAQKSMDFYGKVLGFQETWRGGGNPKELSWINMKVPDGDDYVEFMLYRDQPSKFGTKNHLSLVVPDIQKAVDELKSRPAFKTYGKELTIATGVNQKRQVNIYDPDGTRVEMMEPFTVTGKPTPSSTAPPPPPAHD
ncbi:MAG TPA: VOC family protein [Acidobacteriaceae bacterium]|jgi:lactoylglutathione lyase|nr:VOC family protein [Acidobacteriaceae bacterium]